MDGDVNGRMDCVIKWDGELEVMHACNNKSKMITFKFLIYH